MRAFRDSTTRIRSLTLLSLVALLVCGCGGGGGGGVAPGPVGGAGGVTLTPPRTNVTQTGSWISGQFEDAASFQAQCVAPRNGTNPSTGGPFPDVTGTRLAENNWLRSWSNDLYLWYDEIIDLNPADFDTPAYFDLLRTLEITPSGQPKDKFHFTLDTEEWQSLSQSGVSAGYGATFSLIAASVPRHVVVAYTQPNSPAADPSANLARGATVLEVDGVDLVNATDSASIDLLNDGLFPSGLGERHEFTVQDLGSSTPRTIAMVSASVTLVPVQNVGTVNTSSGTVGYIHFTDHIATSEQQLIDAVSLLDAAGISDLVLDLRYNGGGFLDIASELAYMIAGPGPTAGQAFDESRFNDKHPLVNPVTGRLLLPIGFHSSAQGFSALQGEPLPSLDLSRVFVLTGPETCSASEALINGLRGVDVEVIQIGSTTCGKPYGFYPADNCGTTYFTIQFKGDNAKGFGDYTDGFSPANTAAVEGVPVPGCFVADDFTHALGDPDEGRMSAALAYRVDQSCPSPVGLSASRLSRTKVDLSAVDGEVRKSVWLENRIMRW